MNDNIHYEEIVRVLIAKLSLAGLFEIIRYLLEDGLVDPRRGLEDAMDEEVHELTH